MKKSVLITLSVILITLTIVQAQICIDSDGMNSLNKGYVEYNGKTFDSCKKSVFLNDINYEVVENVCIDEKKDTVNIPCNYQCINGKCIDKSFSVKLKDWFNLNFKKDYGIEEEVVIDCIKQTSLDSLILLGLQGGYLAPEDYIETTSTVISYGYKDNKIKLPSKTELEKELEKYMDIILEYCIENNYKILEDLVDEKPKVKVKIKDNKVSYSVKQKVKKDNKNINVKYNYDIPIKLGKILDISRDVMGGRAVQEPGINILVSKFNDNTKIFSVIDKEFYLEEVPYTFRYAIEGFNKLKNSKKGFLNNVFDWFGIYSGTAVGAYEGGVTPKGECDETLIEVYEPVSQCSPYGNQLEIIYKNVCENGVYKDVLYHTIDCSPNKCITDDNGFGRCAEEEVAEAEIPKPEKVIYRKCFPCKSFSENLRNSYIQPGEYVVSIESPKKQAERKICDEKSISAGFYFERAYSNSLNPSPECEIKIEKQTRILPGSIFHELFPKEVTDNEQLELNIVRIGTNLIVNGWKLGDGEWTPLSRYDEDIKKNIIEEDNIDNIKILNWIKSKGGVIGDLMDDSDMPDDLKKLIKNRIGDKDWEKYNCFNKDYGTIVEDYEKAIEDLNYMVDNCPDLKEGAFLALSDLYKKIGKYQQSNIQYNNFIKNSADSIKSSVINKLESEIKEVSAKIRKIDNYINLANNKPLESGKMLAEALRELDSALYQIESVIKEAEYELSKNPDNENYKKILNQALNIKNQIIGVKETPEIKKDVLDFLDSRIEGLDAQNYAELQTLQSLKKDIESGSVKDSAGNIIKYLKDSKDTEINEYYEETNNKIVRLNNAISIAISAKDRLNKDYQKLSSYLVRGGDGDRILKSGNTIFQELDFINKQIEYIEKDLTRFNNEIAKLKNELEIKIDSSKKIAEIVSSLTGSQEYLQLLILQTYDRCINTASDSVIEMVDKKYGVEGFEANGFFNNPLGYLDQIFFNGNYLTRPLIAFSNSYQDADKELKNLIQKKFGIVILNRLIKEGKAEEFLKASDKGKYAILDNMFINQPENTRLINQYLEAFKATVNNDPNMLLLIFNGDVSALKSYIIDRDYERFRQEYFHSNEATDFDKNEKLLEEEDVDKFFALDKCTDLSRFEKGFLDGIAGSINLFDISLIMLPGVQLRYGSDIYRALMGLEAIEASTLSSLAIEGVRATKTGTIILDGVNTGKNAVAGFLTKPWTVRNGLLSNYVLRPIDTILDNQVWSTVVSGSCKVGELAGEIASAQVIEKFTGIPSSLSFGFIGNWKTFEIGIVKGLGERSALKEVLKDSSNSYILIGQDKYGRNTYRRVLVADNANRVRSEVLSLVNQNPKKYGELSNYYIFEKGEQYDAMTGILTGSGNRAKLEAYISKYYPKFLEEGEEFFPLAFISQKQLEEMIIKRLTGPGMGGKLWDIMRENYAKEGLLLPSSKPLPEEVMNSIEKTKINKETEEICTEIISQ